jgi:GDP-L-fucose synthase
MEIGQKKIFVAGHNGMVGSAIVRALKSGGAENLVLADRSDLDLTSQDAVARFMDLTRPEVLIIAAARVGGIHANNTYPAQFIFENLMIECNLIHAAHQSQCQQVLFLGSSCIYPRDATQPMSEDELLSGPLEPTNEPYGIAKIAGIKLCESYNRQYGRDYRCLMPTNLYGIGDNFHPENSHVIPALIQRIHAARQSGAPSVTLWGSGEQKREFLNVDDLADACVHVLKLSKQQIECATRPMCSHLNVGTGTDITIRQLAETLCDVIGYSGQLECDTSKPDGAPRKLLDVSRIQSLGWQARTPLEQGLRQTYEWFVAHQAMLRR